jgi:hypothetical protein
MIILLQLIAISLAVDPESIYEVNNYRDPEFKGLEYDPALFNSFPDPWKNLDQDTPNSVQLINSDYYDYKIVSRWSSEWLAGNTTWVIGVTKDYPLTQDY